MTTPRVPEERSATQPAPVPARTPASGTAVIDERTDDRADRAEVRRADQQETVAYPTVAAGANARTAPVDAVGSRPVDASGSSDPSAASASAEHGESAPYGAAARRAVVARQREAFGGVKLGSALFGWLTATGTAAILTGTVAGAATALGVDTAGRAAVLTGVASESVGWVAVAVLAAILLVSYWCGGYVAARMARFNGAVQGLAVWVWALVIAIVVSLVSVIIGSQVDVLANANLYPRIQMSPEEFTLAGLAIAAVVLVASLAGAVLGGMSGTRYHRRVDRAGFVEEG
ncbi:hypothetical protein [Agromyces allii]|uniref:hypothetical protein n=1 Tax=Agromyces allii TaxID=393607 RepID=UPI0012FCDA35|nr:hypothetical protein [Agromyces allii]